MKLKKFLSVFLAVAVLLSFGGTAFAIEGKHSVWSELYLEDAEHDNYLPECLQNVDYTQAITREDFCELTYEFIGAIRSTGSERQYPKVTSKTSPFKDTRNKKIIALYDFGIIQGKDETHFAPDALLSREEAATILVRIAKYFSYRIFENPLTFSDRGDISDWAAEGVDAACGMGLMNGIGNGLFAPQDSYSKEQCVATLVRLLYVPHNISARNSDGSADCSNSFWSWRETANGTVIFRLPAHWESYNYRPDFGYERPRFFQHNGKLLASAYGRSDNPASLSYKPGGDWGDVAGTTFLTWQPIQSYFTSPMQRDISMG